MDLNFNFEAFGEALTRATEAEAQNNAVSQMLGFQGVVPVITQQKVSKEITQDIFLEKELEVRQGEQQYVFSLVSKSGKGIQFTADFTGSENCVFYQDQKKVKKFVFTGSIEPVISIEANQIKIMPIVRIKLKEGWKLKTKFHFTLTQMPKNEQKKTIARELLKIIENFRRFQKGFGHICFDKMPLDKTIDTLKRSGDQFHDMSFVPCKQNVYGSNESPLDVYPHWRRPAEFMKPDFEAGLIAPTVFQETLEPYDVKAGALGDEWLLQALVMLAERPALIERLFSYRLINDYGVYKVKICKMGEWQYVTVDDLIPCFPKGPPMFASCYSSEIWAMIIEKACAKVSGGYYQLRGGLVTEALMDLTGCPTVSYNLEDKYTKHFIENGQFWELLLYFQDQGYIISFSTSSGPSKSDVLLPRQSFGVVLVVEATGNKLIKLRSLLQPITWDGDWSLKPNNSLWDTRIKNVIGQQHFAEKEDSANLFWMSFQEAIQYFYSLNVCRVSNWNEIRVKGKFLRIAEPENPAIEQVISKWYYCFDVAQRTTMYIAVHQEDERNRGVEMRRPYLDIGIVLLKRVKVDFEIVDLKDFCQDRQLELEVTLDPGSYIVLPRTTGCTLRRPDGYSNPDKKSRLIQPYVATQSLNDKKLTLKQDACATQLFESTMTDIFNKFDLQSNNQLGWSEFKAFCDVVGVRVSEDEFRQEICCDKFQNSKLMFGPQLAGLSLLGFQNWMLSLLDINNAESEETMMEWLQKLGYDSELFPVRSRNFGLTIHSNYAVDMTIKNAVQTDLDSRANVLISKKFGVIQEATNHFEVFYTFSENVLAYSYCVHNKAKHPMDFLLDNSKSQNMIYSTRDCKVKKRVQSGQTQFFMHSRVKPNVAQFNRNPKFNYRVRRPGQPFDQSF